MEEAKKSLESGQGTPYVALFDINSKPFIDKSNGLYIGQLITSFAYEYDEKDDDKCEITFETDNPNILDQPEYADKMLILVQWGFILPDGKLVSSATRKVIIRDTEVDFTDNGVRVTLKTSDLFSLAKTMPPDRSTNDFAQWLKYNLTGVETKFIDYTVKESINFGNEDYVFDITK